MVSVAPATSSDSALLSAAQWLDGLVQGPAAMTLAVLAVAATGLLMLNGRLPVRRGLTVVLGCFIMFGAPAIARGLLSSTAAISGQPVEQVPPEPPNPQLEPPNPPTSHAGDDPYAGASVAR
jgi:type IV secretory pathway VirB2 component (pilin)